MTRKTAWILSFSCAALPALAQQSSNDIEMLTKHAGTWAVDCAKPGTRLGVDVKRLTLQSGGKQMATSAPPMAALLAVSGAITPSTAPLPKGTAFFFTVRLARS